MAWCLIEKYADQFKQALKEGGIDPFALAEMDSTTRRDYLSQFVGEGNAHHVNTLFESKLLLKNRQRGYITWAKQMSGITKQTRRDLISRIERMDKVLSPAENEMFLEDLAAARLGIGVSQEEAKIISTLSNNKTVLRDKANESGEFSSENDRYQYGSSLVLLEKYVNELKLRSRKTLFREKPVQWVAEGVGNLPGTAKSLVASLDNSFWGRQGIKTLLDTRTSGIWVRNFVKSFGDFGKQLGNFDVMDAIKADILSRPNALNGKYAAGGYGLDVFGEEAFPVSAPGRIPLLGRLFRASESAYNGGALRMRADLADRLIARAEKHGVNTLDPKEARGLGGLVSSLTGRGSLGWAEGGARKINVVLFSVKFMKSNFDTLTAHQFDSKATKFSKGEARKNLLSMVGTLAGVMALAKILDPDSVDEDPRSQNFGKIKVFGHWVDISGGMAPLVTLASRTIVPSKRNGKWGLWKKSGSGNWTNLMAGEYGQQDAVDLVVQGLFTNKLSPMAGLIRDGLRGEMFGGEKFTTKNAVANLITPLSIQSYNDMKDDPNSSFILGSVLLEGMGLSTSTYNYKTDWEKSTSKEMAQFKEKVGTDKFKQANEDYNRAYNNWYSIASKSAEFKSLSDEGRSSLITKAKAEIKEQIFKEYKFKPAKTAKTVEARKEEAKIKSILPSKKNK